MVGSLERIFRRAIRYNVEDIGRSILCPICKSMVGADRELEALNNLFNELKKIEKNPLILRISNLKDVGIFEMRVCVEAYKTHSRTISFPISLGSDPRAETSDIVMLITHEFLESNVTTLVDEKISFFQAKIETKGNGFEITPRQWYLMRYWPKLSYKGRTFDLSSCRRVPDVCSFYLFLFRDRTFDNRIFGTRPFSSVCRINSVCMSTPWMERLMPYLMNLTEKEILCDKSINLSFTDQKQGDRFFGLLLFLLSTHLGVHDPQGTYLMKTMFPESSNRNDPPSDEEGERKPSIGVKITVQVRTESRFVESAS